MEAHVIHFSITLLDIPLQCREYYLIEHQDVMLAGSDNDTEQARGEIRAFGNGHNSEESEDLLSQVGLERWLEFLRRHLRHVHYARRCDINLATNLHQDEESVCSGWDETAR